MGAGEKVWVEQEVSATCQLRLPSEHPGLKGIYALYCQSIKTWDVPNKELKVVFKFISFSPARWTLQHQRPIICKALQVNRKWDWEEVISDGRGTLYGYLVTRNNYTKASKRGKPCLAGCMGQRAVCLSIHGGRGPCVSVHGAEGCMSQCMGQREACLRTDFQLKHSWLSFRADSKVWLLCLGSGRASAPLTLKPSSFSSPLSSFVPCPLLQRWLPFTC